MWLEELLLSMIASILLKQLNFFFFFFLYSFFSPLLTKLGGYPDKMNWTILLYPVPMAAVFQKTFCSKASNSAVD